MSSERIKVVHIINGLDQGGAEIMLLSLLEHMARDRFDAEVISLTDRGALADKIEALGFPVYAVGLRALSGPVRFGALVRRLQRAKPDVVNTWMYHSNVVGGLAARLLGKPSVIWGIHATRLDPATLKIGTYLAILASKQLESRLADRTICCSQDAMAFHTSIGYEQKRIVCIPNGFDVSRFHRDAEARRSVRVELGLAEDTILVGMIARYHPNKDFRNFFIAAAKLRARIPNVHFICCGRDVTRANPELAAILDEFSVGDRVSLLGMREDVPRLVAALDVAALSSFIGEAFPLTLGEAMACGVPCVATDVGDSRLIIGDTGRVVPIRDPEALADAWEEILNLSKETRLELGRAARERVLKNFSIESVAREYEALYLEAAKIPAKHRPGIS